MLAVPLVPTAGSEVTRLTMASRRPDGSVATRTSGTAAVLFSSHVKAPLSSATSGVTVQLSAPFLSSTRTSAPASAAPTATVPPMYAGAGEGAGPAPGPGSGAGADAGAEPTGKNGVPPPPPPPPPQAVRSARVTTDSAWGSFNVSDGMCARPMFWNSGPSGVSRTIASAFWKSNDAMHHS
jgi:hypothetical protein